MTLKMLPIVIFATGIFLVMPSPASAAGTSGYGQTNECTPVYGGGSQCPKAGVVIVDKKVNNPATGVYVDNLTADDPKYRPGDTISFRISLRNSGEDTVEKITVKDIFPMVDDQPVIDFMSGPGKYDQETNTMSFTVSNLTQDNEQTFEVKGKIRHASVLPDKNIFCPEPGNRIEAMIEGQERAETDEATFCIMKDMEQAMETPAIPDAGPQDWIVLFGGLFSSFFVGQYLRKSSIRNA